MPKLSLGGVTRTKMPLTFHGSGKDIHEYFEAGCITYRFSFVPC